jgi:hypothetical protein
VIQLSLLERFAEAPPVPEKYRSADEVPTGNLVGLAYRVAERHHAPPLYRVRWTYTGWRCAVFGERHVSEPMSREEARRLFASRATMAGVGRVEILVECEQHEQEVCDG